MSYTKSIVQLATDFTKIKQELTDYEISLDEAIERAEELNDLAREENLAFTCSTKELVKIANGADEEKEPSNKDLLDDEDDSKFYIRSDDDDEEDFYSRPTNYDDEEEDDTY